MSVLWSQFRFLNPSALVVLAMQWPLFASFAQYSAANVVTCRDDTEQAPLRRGATFSYIYVVPQQQIKFVIITETVVVTRRNG